MEGRCMCPLRIVVQSKIEKIKIENFSVEMWDESDDHCVLKNFAKNQAVTEHFEELNDTFLEIFNFRLGEQLVMRSNAESLGRLRFDSWICAMLQSPFEFFLSFFMFVTCDCHPYLEVF